MNFKNFVKALVVGCFYVTVVFAEAPIVDLSQGDSALQEEHSKGSVSTFPAAPEPMVMEESPDNSAPNKSMPNNNYNVEQKKVEPQLSSLSLEQRISRLEQQMNNIVQMNVPARLDELQQETQKLNGQSETSAHDLKVLNQKLTDFYKDLASKVNLHGVKKASIGSPKGAEVASSDDENVYDSDVLGDDSDENEGGSQTAKSAGLKSAGTTLQSSPSAMAIETEQQSVPKEQKEYEYAFNFLQQKKYKEASIKLGSYLKKYPKGTYAINAHYWLAQCHYLMSEFKEAESEFKVIVTKHPSSTKAPDSLLRLGIIHNSNGDHAKAKQEFLQVIKRFPGSHAAKLAAQQLKSIPSD